MRFFLDFQRDIRMSSRKNKAGWIRISDKRNADVWVSY